MTQMKTFFHPDEKWHHPQTYLSRGKMRKPQETPERVEHILKGIEMLDLPILQPNDYGMQPLLDVHDAGYVKFLETAHARWKEIALDWGDEVMSNVFVRHPNPMRGILAEAARYLADGSCPIGHYTWTSAYWAAQCAASGAYALLEGEQKAYALCRPPGHHARRDAAGGFCYINNSAVAAQILRKEYRRVVVLDTDMHHGQGVQEIFYGRDDILYISIHGDPTNFYPVVAGFDDECGEGQGLGYNINLPMPHHSSEQVFFEKLFLALDALRGFKPDALVLSLGFDIFRDDPQSLVEVTTDGLGQLGKHLSDLTIPTLVVQEGGYHFESLTANTVSFFSGLLNRA